MKKYLLKLLVMLLLGSSLSACTNGNDASKAKLSAEEMTFSPTIEPVTGKLNVYSSMARSVKYNVDVANENIHRKVFPLVGDQSPQDIMHNILNVQGGGENPLYNAVRVLDYAVIYAVSNLSNNQEYINSNLYAKSAQQLAMATVKMHKDSLFAQRKIREIDRFIAAETKVLAGLNKKLSNNGTLTPGDLELRKGIEVGILKLKEMRAVMAQGMAQYASLVKANEAKMVLEGRHFYELEDFDKKNTLESFQNAALLNRNEFALSRVEAKEYSAEEVMQNAVRMYPEIEALNINGYNISDTLYVENLQTRAAKIAETLVTLVGDYKAEKDIKAKEKLKIQAFDVLGVAILAQVELDYDIVRISDRDFAASETRTKELQQEVKTLNGARNPSAEQKVELLNAKISVIGQSFISSQISAERAMALRGLYFHSGLSPFDKKQMTANIAGIEENLKVSFNNDMVEILARTTARKANPVAKKDNEWAKGSNWLDKLVDAKMAAKAKKVEEANGIGNFEPYVGEMYDKKMVMQLGSYKERLNADIEWRMLQELYPELSHFTPHIEEFRLDGTKVYRLLLDSENGGFLNLCNQLRADKVDCVLRGD